MKEARELLQELWAKGIELRVEDGGLQAKPSNLVNASDREQLSSHKLDVVRLLNGEASFLDPHALKQIKRLASRIGTVVEYEGGKAQLIGVFRDKAVIDTGKVIISLNHKDVLTGSRS